jgi:hypothetical protein
LVSSETLGGFLHRLLMRAVVVLVLRLWHDWPPGALHERSKAER